MDNLEIYKTLVLSTAHMTEEDNDLLLVRDGPISYEMGEYGWLVLVEPQMLQEADIKEFSYGFKQSIILAQAKECDWLRFDRDANIVEGIITYDW